MYNSLKSVMEEMRITLNTKSSISWTIVGNWLVRLKSASDASVRDEAAAAVLSKQGFVWADGAWRNAYGDSLLADDPSEMLPKAWWVQRLKSQEALTDKVLHQMVDLIVGSRPERCCKDAGTFACACGKFTTNRPSGDEKLPPDEIAELRKLRNQGMSSAVGEYTPPEFWDALDEIERLRKGDGKVVAWMRRNVTYRNGNGRTDGERIVSESKVYEDDLPLCLATSPQPRGDMVLVENIAVALHRAFNNMLDHSPEWPQGWPGWKGATPEEQAFFLRHAQAALAAAPGEGSGERECCQKSRENYGEPCHTPPPASHPMQAKPFDHTKPPPPPAPDSFGKAATRTPASRPVDPRAQYDASGKLIAYDARGGGMYGPFPTSQSAPSADSGPEPGEPAPPPNTPAQHYLASVNGAATQSWQDGFNEASRLATAGRREWAMITLTGLQIKELAEFVGFSVNADGLTDELETPITITKCPPEGIRNDGEPSDPGAVSHYEFIAYCSEYPEEGCIGLGPEITPPPASQSAPSAGSGELRWITQTKFYDPAIPESVASGNCTQAALASILGLPLTSVPDFLGLATSEFWDAVEDFVGSLGFWLDMRSGSFKPDGMYLASGPSPRGCSHMVVMENGRLRHDPHPSREGIASVDHVYVLTPKDPGRRLVTAGQGVE